MSVSRPLDTFPFSPSIRQLLLRCGFHYQHDIEHLQPSHLATELGISPQQANDIIKIVRGLHVQTTTVSGGIHGDQTEQEIRSSNSILSASPVPLDPDILLGSAQYAQEQLITSTTQGLKQAAKQRKAKYKI